MTSFAKTDFRLATSLVALALAGFAVPAVAADAAAADDQQAAAAADEPSEDTTIIVTGTRRTDRTVLESAVPVDVFSADDFKAQPAPQLQSILQTLVPSFNQQRNLLGDGSAFIRPPTLRGLPADQILVLVNGKRMHRSALVQISGGALNAGAQGADLSQLASPAVGRVEVLRDGAAAQYGSDAIAGVINLGLRRDDGFEVTARYGQTYEGDGQDTQITAFYGTKLGEDGGFVNFTGEFIDQNIWDRSVPRPTIAPLVAQGIIPSIATGNRLGGPENRAYRGVVNMELPAGDTTFYAFAHYGWQRQGNDFNFRPPVATTHDAIPGRPGTASTPAAVNPVFLDRVGFDSQGRALWDVNGARFNIFNDPRFPEMRNGYTPFFENTNEDLGIVAGFKGAEFGINYDISLMYGQNQIRYFMNDTINRALGPNTPTDFYMGKFVQREFNFNADFSVPVEVGFYKPLNIAWGVEVRREAFEVGLGDRASWEVGPYASQLLVECQLGGSIVPCSTPGSTIVPGAAINPFTGTRVPATQSPGSDGFQGFGPASVTEGGRNNYSAYLDLEATVVEGLDVGVAARYDYFNDFGDTFNGKISARYAFNEAIAIRGAASTGFRAPTPGQQFTQNLTTGFPFGSTVPLGIATVRADSAIGAFYLAQPLSPEKSRSFSGGIVVQPGAGFTLTVDYYNIKVDDRIGLTGNINPNQANPGGQTATQFLLSQGVAEAAELGAVRYFTNAFDTRTQGVDIVLSHKADTGIGRFNSSLAVNYNKTKVTDRKVINGTLANGQVLSNFRPVDDVRVTNIERNNPNWRAVLSTNWTNGMFDATGRVNYYGKFASRFDPITSGFGATPGVPDAAAAAALYPNPFIKEFKAQASIDLEVGVTFQEQFRLAVGAQNLLNTYPERETRNIFPSTGGAANGSIYPDTAPIGQQGGFWYVRASAKF
ncbi:TonB-dependent receptor plug domain-containing protein [Sandarakinorhabdus rubra]|uniref:TonB-dependent receptor plug domain-containing protein n=1 Tax=Sandarakinorhabdus rubra TaxID=2672568 RepID=UPI0013D90E92|nr:TonB-dependent receptor [Sandarakinorhabdus rubra]